MHRERREDNELAETHPEPRQDENPAGGHVTGTGIEITWQNGPLGRGKKRKKPNGAFVEDVIDAAKQRIDFYQTAQDGKFACKENEEALGHLKQALAVLDLRTKKREAREVEGTHEK